MEGVFDNLEKDTDDKVEVVERGGGRNGTEQEAKEEVVAEKIDINDEEKQKNEMTKEFKRWRLASLNINIVWPFVKLIGVFSSLLFIISSVSLVICACFLPVILRPLSYNTYICSV